MKNISVLVLFFCLASSFAQAQGSAYVVESAKLMSKVKANPQGVLLVDVRSAVEFDKGSLPNAVQIDPTAPDFIDQVKSLKTPQIGMVVLVCLTGEKSAQAAETLRMHGLGEVFSMNGGLMALARTSEASMAHLAPKPENGGITRQEFTDMIYSAPNVLFHFTSAGDPQHAARMAEYEALNRQFEGRLNIVTLDVYEHPFITSKFAYTRLPYYMWFTADGMKWEHNGPLTQQAILNTLAE